MQLFASCPHTAPAACGDRRCRLSGAARPRAASPLPLAPLGTLWHRGSTPHSPRHPSAARLHQPLLHGSPLTLRQPRPEGAPQPPAPLKGRRDEIQTPPEGRQRRHDPGVFEGPQARRERLSTAAAPRQGLPAVLLGPPAAPRS